MFYKFITYSIFESDKQMKIKQNEANTINICIASDNNYAPLIATTIASTCSNTSRFIKYYCLESNISDFNKRMIDTLHEKFKNFEIEYITIDKQLIQNFACKLSTSGHISADTYSRLYIPNIFSNMEKMIYLDVDLIVTGDIGDLYDIDLGRYSIGAVAADYGVDKSQWYNNMEMSCTHHYFNAGVLLLNPKELYASHFLEKISKIANKYSKYIVLGDQDLLNKYSHLQYKELPWRFNLTTRFIELELAHNDPQHRLKMQEEYNNCVIRHFESHKKPWNAIRNECNHAKIKNMMEFWTVANMTPYYSWFLIQYNTSMLEITQGNIYSYINAHNALPEKKIFKLFGFIPLLSKKVKPNKLKYKLFTFIPLLYCKFNNDGRKRSYKLFNLIPLLSIKSKK